MTTYEIADLHQRVARYEAALDELRAAHQDVRHVLLDQVLYDRWLQIGAELGFAIAPQPVTPQAGVQQQHELSTVNQQIPQMSEAWAG
jgi:hypothetical protein